MLAPNPLDPERPIREADIGAKPLLRLAVFDAIQ